MQIDITPILNTGKDILVILGTPIIRSVFGWAEKSLNDNKITRFELKKLTQTIIRVGLIAVMGYYGFTIAGVDNAAIAASVGAFFADKLFGALKENKNVK